jgi:ribosomal protein L22
MTEKDYNAQQRTAKTLEKQKVAEKKKVVETPVEKIEKKENTETKKENAVEEKKETKDEKKTPIVKKQIEKKDEAVVNGVSLHLSTKKSVAICKFIRGKSIDKAIADLEEVEKLKRAIPMTGEIPHQKGKGMMSGRYMTKSVEVFIRMLKDLKANSNVNGIEEPVIAEAIPNRASRPRGRFGAWKRKRTHIFIKAVEKNKLKNKKQKEKKK